MAKYAALKDKVGVLESEMQATRENNKGAYRQQEKAEQRAKLLEDEVALARKQVAQLEGEKDRLNTLLAAAQETIATASANEVLAVTHLGGDSGDAKVVYLEKVSSLEKRLAAQAHAIRQQERREDALAARARVLERELVKRGVVVGESDGALGVGVEEGAARHPPAGGACLTCGKGGESEAKAVARALDAGTGRLRAKVEKKRVQVVKWKQEAVRSEEARGLLEAEVLDVRSSLLSEQQRRSGLEAALTAERRQLAFLQKRVVRLEAELRTASERGLEQQQKMESLKLALDRYTVCRPELSVPLSTIRAPSVASAVSKEHATTQTGAEFGSGVEKGAGGRESLSSSPSKLPTSPLKVKRRLDVVSEGGCEGAGGRLGEVERRDGRARSSSNSPSKALRAGEK